MGMMAVALAGCGFSAPAGNISGQAAGSAGSSAGTAGEAAKSGFAPDELEQYLPQMAQFSAVRVRGLMAIPPICEKTEEIRPYFRSMKQLFVDIGAKKYDNVSMDFLSMGMSADFETAIEEGANIVRVGTGIFGARHY